MSSDAPDLAEAIRRIAACYPIDTAQLDACLQRLFLDVYAEVVLLRDGLEIVVGGVDQRDRLIALAQEMGVPGATIAPFARFSEQFPARIGYLKLGFGRDAAPPTMHCGAMTRWRDIVAFAEEQPGFVDAAHAVAALREGESICNLVAFSSVPGSDVPMMKLYWLLDQEGGGRRSPMLAAARVAQGRLRAESKLYWMGAEWDAARIDPRWSGLVDAAQAIFGHEAYRCLSQLRRGDAVLESKLYLFVQDSRIAARDRPTSLNLYYPEGLQYLYWQDYARAAQAFSNAFAFDPTHAHALNNRGFCKLQLGEVRGALADFEQALLLDPALSTINRDHAHAMLAMRQPAGA
jgi:hypothetical protein